MSPQILGCVELRLDGSDDVLSDLVLDREDVGEGAVVALDPDVRSTCRIDELAGDPQSLACLANPSPQNITNSELAPDLAHVDRLAPVDEARIARDHQEPLYPREPGDDVLDHSISKIILCRIVAEIDEGQHRNREPGAVFRARGRFRVSMNAVGPAVDRSHETVADAGDRRDPLPAARRLSQVLPEGSDLNLEIRLFDGGALPSRIDEVGFGQHLARTIQKGCQKKKSPIADWHRFSPAQKA